MTLTVYYRNYAIDLGVCYTQSEHLAVDVFLSLSED